MTGGAAALLLTAGYALPAHAQLFKGKSSGAPDACAVASKELQGAKGAVTRTVISRGVLGAALGAGATLLTKRDAKASDVAKGAAGGALIGAGVGYLEAKRQQAQDAQALAGSIYQDMAASNGEAARALRAFTQARGCRLQQAQLIKTAHQSGRLDAETAQKQLTDQRLKLELDIQQVQKFLTDYDRTMDDFESAAGYLAQGRETDLAYVGGLKSRRNALIMRDTALVAPPPTPRLKAQGAVNVREKPDAASAKIGALAAGQLVDEVVEDETKAGWRKIKLADGRTGYVTEARVRPAEPAQEPVKKDPPLPKADALSPEMRFVAAPMFEGVEKRSALSTEIKAAQADSAGATFTL
ncbi:hypothetical protein AS593_19740 [Caulobacter vibrioides]|nr:hypothetical protein AS593_19740 [Caulobacter vibrioides]